MSRPAPKIQLSSEEKETLLRWMRSPKSEQRMVERARVILLASNGLSGRAIASRMRTREARISKWLGRFVRDRIAGLEDSERSAEKRRKYTAATEERILKALDQKPPSGYSRWNGRLLAEHLGDVSKHQGWIRLPNGRAMTGFAHEYKRNGTTTLFAALEVASGLVHAGHYRRRRRREFLDFMNDLVAKYPARELHVILDNLNTHKPRNDRWLKAHPSVHLHFIPTHSSWLNQIECWFSILSRSALQGASFTNVRTLVEAIEAFISHWNQTAAPFEWTKEEVHPQTLKHSYAELCN